MDRRSFLIGAATLPFVSDVGDSSFATKHAGDEVYLERCTGNPKTLVCHIHAWSSDYLEVRTWPDLKNIPNCALVAPHFGGPNNHPQAAGHPAQLERIYRVIQKAQAEHRCTRVILCGYSGGGYVALMLLAAYPGVAYGGSLWVFPNDLAAWWRENSNHRVELQACLGGTPADVPARYLARSPKGVAASISGRQLYLNSGRQDVEVLPHHQVDARDQLAAANTIVFNSYATGHVFQPSIAVKQLVSMLI